MKSPNITILEEIYSFPTISISKLKVFLERYFNSIFSTNMKQESGKIWKAGAGANVTVRLSTKSKSRSIKALAAAHMHVYNIYVASDCVCRNENSYIYYILKIYIYRHLYIYILYWGAAHCQVQVWLLLITTSFPPLWMSYHGWS